jgi:transcriptional regulator with XRE-family HTH domain
MGISQGKLGEALGFKNGQFISNIEISRDIQYPVKYFKKISKILNVSISELIPLAASDYITWLERQIYGK